MNFPITNQPTLFVFNHDSIFSDSTRLVFREIIFACLTAAKKDHNTVMVLPQASVNKRMVESLEG